MLTLLNSQIGLLIGAITMIGLIWGPKAWPSVYTWLGNIWKSITYPLRGTERKVLSLTDSVGTLAEQHKDMSKKLDFIVEQFSPNGGCSLKDSLNRIESKQVINEVMSIYFVNAIEAPMFKTDPHGACTWASKSYLKITGKSLEDTLGWGWLSVIHRADEKEMRAELTEAVRDKRAFQSKYRIVNDEGVTLNIISKTTPSIFNGEIVAWVGEWEIDDGGEV